MKANKIVTCVLFMLVFMATLMIATTATLEANLRCGDLAACQNGGGCFGPGWVDGCAITCQSGPVIDCGVKAY